MASTSARSTVHDPDRRDETADDLADGVCGQIVHAHVHLAGGHQQTFADQIGPGREHGRESRGNDDVQDSERSAARDEIGVNRDRTTREQECSCGRSEDAAGGGGLRQP